MLSRDIKSKYYKINILALVPMRHNTSINVMQTIMFLKTAPQFSSDQCFQTVDQSHDVNEA